MMVVLKVTCRKCGSFFVITNSFQGRIEDLQCPSCGKEFTKDISDNLKEYFKAEIKLRDSLTHDKDINFEFVSSDIYS